MPITLSDHAIQQLRKHELSEELVIHVVHETEDVVSSYRGRKLRRKRVVIRY
jgi:hypothetical protein